MDELKRRFAAEFRAVTHGCSVHEITRRAHIGQSSISQYQRGIAIPSENRLRSIAVAFPSFDPSPYFGHRKGLSRLITTPRVQPHNRNHGAVPMPAELYWSIIESDTIRACGLKLPYDAWERMADVCREMRRANPGLP